MRKVTVMSRRMYGLSVLLILAGLLALAGGCPRTPPSAPPAVIPGTSPPGTPPAPGVAPGVPPTTVTSAIPTGKMGEIVTAHNKVTSYEVTTMIGGKPGLKAEVKLDQGKVAAMRVKVAQGYALVLPSEQVMYLLNTKAKTAAKLSFGKQAQGYVGKLPSPMALAAKQPTVTDSKLGTMDCWLLEWTGAKGEKVQMWMDKQYGLPQKSQHGALVTKYTYANVNKVPDSVFAVPQGYKVKEMEVGAPGGGAAPSLPPPPAAHPGPGPAPGGAASPAPGSAPTAPNVPAAKPPAAKPPPADKPSTAPGLTPGP